MEVKWNIVHRIRTIKLTKSLGNLCIKAHLEFANPKASGR